MSGTLTYEALQKRVKKLENEALARSHIEEMYRVLVEHSLQGLVIVQDAHIVFANAAFAEISGYTTEELLSLSPDEVRALIHPDDQALVWGRLQARVEGKPAPPRYEYRGMRKDGTVLWLEMVANRIEFRGKNAIQGAIIDVTDRKRAEEALLESEEKYRLFVESANEGIVLTQEGKIAYINPRALEVMGYPEEEMISRNFMEFIHPDDREKILGLYFQKLKGEDIPPSTYRIIDKDRSTRWVESRSTVLTYEGKPALLTFLIDLAERNRIEEMLQESERQKESILDSLVEHVIHQDMDMKIRWANRAACESAGMTREELLSRHCYEIWPQRTDPCPDCPVIEAMNTGQPHEIEKSTPDGRAWYIRGYSVRDPHDTIVGGTELTLEITERKQAQMALRESEEKYKGIFNTVPTSIILIDKDGQMVDINPYHLTHIAKGKFPKKEFIGKNIITHPTIVNAGLSETYKKVLEGEPFDKKNVYFPSLLPGGDGYFNVKGVPLLKNHAVIGALIMHEDITEGKRADDALKESEAQKRAILDASVDRIRLCDTDMKIIWANETHKRQLAIAPEDLAGKACYEVFAGRNAPCPECPGIKALTSGITEHSVLVRQERGRGGPEEYLDFYAVPIKDESGRIDHILSIIRDITAEKRAAEALRLSEERYRAVVDHASDAIIVAQDNMLKFVNPKATEITGYPTDELCSRPFTDFIYPEDRAMVADNYKRRLEGEEFPTIYPFRIIDREGNIHWLEINAVVIDWEGKPATLNFLRDITQQRSLEAQLQHAQRMKAIGTLAGGIAHDFNNILSAIMGYTEIALFHESSEGSPARKSLEQVLSAGERAKDLVKQILAFSRQAEEERRPILLEPLVKEALKLVRATLPSTIEIRQFIAPHVGSVMADPTQIHQVLMNLCTNAYHAIRGEGGVLEVRLEPTTLNADEAALRNLRSGNYLALSVSDTGCGMSPEVVERIFDPYFTTKEKAMGTGLGLAVVHGIVKGHGGAISVESKLGKGSTFTVYLPLIEDVKLLKEAETEESLPTGDERILLIDDEPTLVDIGKQMLERLGYRVVIRTSSTEALELFRRAPDEFDLIITDQTMPQMTGDQLAKEVMKLHPCTPIILCTGFSEKISKQEAIAMGIKAFLMKPLVITDLAKTIRKVLDDVAEELWSTER
jgi:PAS domain S-box-containing protein